MTWYLDGNNILGGGRSREGRDARPGLLNHLLSLRLPKPCVVVFDGPPFPQGAGLPATRGALRVLFSGARTADALIVERLRRGDTVVTRDRELGLRARDRQARPLSPEAFFGSVAPARGVSPSEKPAVPGDLEEWLRIFGEKDGGA